MGVFTCIFYEGVDSTLFQALNLYYLAFCGDHILFCLRVYGLLRFQALIYESWLSLLRFKDVWSSDCTVFVRGKSEIILKFLDKLRQFFGLIAAFPCCVKNWREFNIKLFFQYMFYLSMNVMFPFLRASLNNARDFWFSVQICNKNLRRMNVMLIGCIYFFQLFAASFLMESLLYWGVS